MNYLNNNYLSMLKRFRVVEFRPGLYHVTDNKTPIHDDNQDGNDRPLVFTDIDIADTYVNELNNNNQ